MVEISTLLSLPKGTSAFSSLPATARDEAVMRHKVAKLSVDADSASSSRNRTAPGINRATSGYIRVQIGGLNPPQPSSNNDILLRQVKASIRAMLDYDFTEQPPLSRDRLYAVTRHLVVNTDRSEDILAELKVQLDKAVSSMYKVIISHDANASLFQSLAVDLDRFEREVEQVRGALAFLDRLYIAEVFPGDSIRKIADARLSQGIFEKIDFGVRLNKAIELWLSDEHETGTPHIARESVSRVIRHLQMHQAYPALFETLYIDCTRKYYAAQFVEQEKAGPRAFLKFAIEKLDEEVERAHAVLPESSRNAAGHAAVVGLVDGHAEWLAKGVIGPLLDEENMLELKAVHDLLLRAGVEPTAIAAFKSAMLERVSAIVKDAEHDDEMIDRLLKFKSTCDTALDQALASPHRDYSYALSDGFSAGYLVRERAPAEMLAKYVDRLMRKGHQGASDEEFERKLDAVLALYRYTHDKDVFRTFYHRALSRRLLLGRSASDDFEKSVLKKLKEQYDPEFGMGDQMFNDLVLSRDMMQEYRDRHAENSQAQRLTVMILQQSVWPFSSRQEGDLHLPQSMEKDLVDFSKFYKEKHKGRKLDWNHALGTATLTARFPTATKTQDKTKDLTVSLYQAAVLLLFEDVDPSVEKQLGFKEILATLGIRDTELRRTLLSLASGKKRVLKKLPPGRDVKDDDKFTINEQFRDPLHTVHINSIQAKETPEESKRTQQAIQGDRKHVLDAAIVRIMKAKKQLTYEEIKTQTIEAVQRHFAPDVASIKQRIDSLVEGEYMRRDEEDRTLFYYVA